MLLVPIDSLLSFSRICGYIRSEHRKEDVRGGQNCFALVARGNIACDLKCECDDRAVILRLFSSFVEDVVLLGLVLVGIESLLRRFFLNARFTHWEAVCDSSSEESSTNVSKVPKESPVELKGRFLLCFAALRLMYKS